MRIRPALKGRNKILDHKPVLPLQGVTILNTGPNSQGGALGWHVTAPSGRDSKSATSKKMIDADQSRGLHLRKIPRTIGDVPDGPTVHSQDNHDGQSIRGGTIVDPMCRRTPDCASDQAGRVRRACDDAPLSFPVRLCYLLWPRPSVAPIGARNGAAQGSLGDILGLTPPGSSLIAASTPPTSPSAISPRATRAFAEAERACGHRPNADGSSANDRV